jgi:hypothetical protein
MTFKALSNIIKKHKERPTQLARQQEQEIAVINTLRANHHKAYQEREEYYQYSPSKKFYERSEEDNRRDCTIDEWFWDFFERVHVSESAEVRYQLERDPDHGFGHKSKIHGFDEKCEPGCRYYGPAGRLTVFDILEDHRGYQKFDCVWQTYKELEAEGSLPTE